MSKRVMLRSSYESLLSHCEHEFCMWLLQDPSRLSEIDLSGDGLWSRSEFLAWFAGHYRARFNC